MSTIKISQLSAVGSELFDDSETFLHELADSELAIMGGTSDGDIKDISVVTNFDISLPCTVSPANYIYHFNRNTLIKRTRLC